MKIIRKTKWSQAKNVPQKISAYMSYIKIKGLDLNKKNFVQIFIYKKCLIRIHFLLIFLELTITIKISKNVLTIYYPSLIVI